MIAMGGAAPTINANIAAHTKALAKTLHILIRWILLGEVGSGRGKNPTAETGFLSLMVCPAPWVVT